MCISVQGRGDYIVVDNLIIAAKTFKKVDSGRKLGGTSRLYVYEFDDDGWAIPDNQEQEVHFEVRDTIGDTIHLTGYLDLGYHVKPISMWYPSILKEPLITAFVVFYTKHVQLVGISEMVVETFKIASIELLKGLSSKKLGFAKKDVLEQQTHVLEIVSKKGD